MMLTPKRITAKFREKSLHFQNNTWRRRITQPIQNLTCYEHKFTVYSYLSEQNRVSVIFVVVDGVATEM